MKAAFVCLLLLLLAALLMLPRIQDAHFGLLDDGITMLNCRDLAHHPLGAFSIGKEHGRFFPFYFLYYLMAWFAAGENPAGIFTFNLLALALSAILLAWTAHLRGGSRWQAFLTGAFFIWSLPVANTYNTMSKAEVPQCLFLAAGLAAASVTTPWTPRLALTAVLLASAILSKETSYAVVPAAGAALVFVSRQRHEWWPVGRTPQALFFAAALAAAAFVFTTWKLFQPDTVAPGAYAAHYQLGAARLTNALWYLAFLALRSWAFAIPLLAGALLLWRHVGATSRTMLLEGLAWAASFLAILLPWPGIFDYLMAPAAIGIAFAVGFALPTLVQIARQAGHPRWLAAPAVAASLFMLPLHVSTIRADQSIQLLADRANFRMVEELSRLPQNSRVFFNMPPHEYISEVQLYLREMLGRQDISVAVLDYDHRAAASQSGPYYIASAAADSVFGIFVRGMPGDSDTKPRGNMLDSFLGPPAQNQVAARVLETAGGDDFAPQSALCGSGTWSAGPCALTRPFHLVRRLSYGWTVYRVSRDPSEPPVPVRVRADGIWEFFPPGASARTLRFGVSGDTPLKGDFDGDGRDEIGVFRPSDLSWRLDLNMDGKPHRVFRLDSMQPGDVPVVGDWDGNGTSTPGFFRPKDGTWRLRNAPDAAELVVNGFGPPDAVPFAGDWNRSGRSSIGFYLPRTGETYLRSSLTDPHETTGFLMSPGGAPVAADWNGMGYDTLALGVAGKWIPRRVNTSAAPFGDPKPLELPTDGRLLAGRWKKLP